jgi:hypothetical protein
MVEKTSALLSRDFGGGDGSDGFRKTEAVSYILFYIFLFNSKMSSLSSLGSSG